MPVVSIVTNPLDMKQKRELIAGVTDVCCRVMQLPAEKIVVILDEKPADAIGIAGMLLADRLAGASGN